MKTIPESLLTWLFCLICIACSERRDSGNFIETFNADFRAELAGLHVSNASYAVFCTDSVILQDSFSAAGTGTDGDSPFLIGSVTKVFTAVAIMQLYQEGKIDIDRSNYQNRSANQAAQQAYTRSFRCCWKIV